MQTIDMLLSAKIILKELLALIFSEVTVEIQKKKMILTSSARGRSKYERKRKKNFDFDGYGPDRAV